MVHGQGREPLDPGIAPVPVPPEPRKGDGSGLCRPSGAPEPRAGEAGSSVQGLTPLAIDRRPSGAKKDFPDRL